MLDLLYDGLGHRPPTRNVLQELRNVFYPFRAAVRNQQNCSLAHYDLAAMADVLNSCTNSARFFTLSTGVCGRIPCPRLKTCPGRPSASLRMFSARCLTSF